MQKTFLTGLLSIILLLCLISSSEQKIQKGEIRLSHIKKEGFKYFSRFGVDIGKGSFTFRARLKNKTKNKNVLDMIENENEEISFQFVTVLDKDYELFDEHMSCQQKYELAKSKFKVTIPQDASWSNIVKNNLNQSQRQHMWYFALGTCDMDSKILEKYDFRIVYEFEILNSDESHFSSEETYMPGIYLLACISSIVGIGYVFFLYSKQKERDEPVIYLLLSFVLLFLHCFFYYWHLVSYGYDGVGSRILRILSTLSDTASQTVIIVLLVQLAWGWTITYEKYVKSLILPLFAGIGLIKLVVIGLGFLSDGRDLKYHNYSGWVGVITILIRIGFAGYFIFCLLKTMQTARQKIQEFASKLLIWGTVYMLALPIAVIIGSCLAYYLQHRFISITNLIFQIQGLLFLSLNFLSKSSGYQKVAMKNKTELPTGFGYGSKYD